MGCPAGRFCCGGWLHGVCHDITGVADDVGDTAETDGTLRSMGNWLVCEMVAVGVVLDAGRGVVYVLEQGRRRERSF